MRLTQVKIYFYYTENNQKSIIHQVNDKKVASTYANIVGPEEPTYKYPA